LQSFSRNNGHGRDRAWAPHAQPVEASRESCSVLAINGGSSSIRFSRFDESEPLRRLLDGKVDRVGLSGANFTVKDSTGLSQDGRTIDPADHHSAVACFYWTSSKRSRCVLRSKPWDTQPERRAPGLHGNGG
jgi:hypothetical protein